MIYKRLEDFSSAELWAMRQKVIVNSIYFHHYENDYGISTDLLCTFFDGYYRFIMELAEEKYDDLAENNLDEFDNKDNLFSWFNCFDDFSWVKYDYDKELKDLANEIVNDFKNELTIENIFNILLSILSKGKYTLDKLWDIYLDNSITLYNLVSKNRDYVK